MNTYTALAPQKSPPVRASHAELYRLLEALNPGDWLPLRCASRTAARHLGTAVQARYRKTRTAGASHRCESRIDPQEPIIYLRLVPRKGD